MIMKLPSRTPEPAIFFLSGSMPIEAYIHLRQLSLFAMICQKKDNILCSIASAILCDAKPSVSSWFQTIRSHCVTYNLPHPLHLLESPPERKKFKIMCKEKVHEFWRNKLIVSLKSLPSLSLLKPEYLSLQHPHPVWTSLDSNPYQAKAARIQALFLSGRYMSERFSRFWSKNPEGICILDQCIDLKIFDDYSHILLHCQSLSDARRRLFLFMETIIAAKPFLQSIWLECFLSADDTSKLQFLLDCSTIPVIMRAHQLHGDSILAELFKATRTWCRAMHVARSRKLGRWLD